MSLCFYKGVRRIQLLKLKVYSVYFDLTAPASVVDRIKTESTVMVSPGQTDDTGAGWKRLMLPRLHYLEYSTTKSIENQYKEEDLKDQTPAQTRSRAEHGVVGFVRRLPEGARPSSEAVENYRADIGLESAQLPDGYTWVRPHTRGLSPSNSLGHKVVQRPS